jgi:hypothetical protein
MKSQHPQVLVAVITILTLGMKAFSAKRKQEHRI